MKIFSASFSPHDHNTYDGKYHYQAERFTRIKHNLPRQNENVYPLNGQHIEEDRSLWSDNGVTRKAWPGIEFYKQEYKPKNHEIFAFTTTIGGLQALSDFENPFPQECLDWKPEKLWDYKMIDNMYYIDHHQSHAAYAYLSSGYEESDILAIDGRGYNFNCIFIDKNKTIHDLSDKINIGSLWNYISQQIDFGYLGAGKVMGLSAYGNMDDRMYCLLEGLHQGLMTKDDFENSDIFPYENLAHCLQKYTEDLIIEHVYPLKTSNSICIAGGVAYNGYVNEMLYDNWDYVHVPPAAGDEGQALGTYMHADYNLNNNIHNPSVYSGKEFLWEGEEKADYKEIAQAIADGAIIGWFQGKSESGNRALGNRSILADPRRWDIKQVINSKIKMREDFRPFAPSVLEDYYQDYFLTKETSPYMSRIVKIKNADKARKVPGVVHIDGTSRIQTVNKNQNEKYYNLINEFYKITGVPMLLNTSFNCNEPIVETPEEAIETFNKTGLDLLIINDYILRK